MLLLTQLAGFGAGGRGPAAQFGSSASTGADGATQTLTGLSFNAPAGDRYIIAACIVVGGSVSSISSVTIGGVSATIVVQAQSSTPNRVAGLAIASVPTGTSGNVVITGNSSSARAAAATWSVTGLNSATATDTATQTTSGDPMSTTIDVLSKGIVFATAGENTSGTRTSTWTGVTEDFDINNFGDGSANAGGGHEQYTSAQTGLTIQVNWSASPSGGVLVAAAFR